MTTETTVTSAPILIDYGPVKTTSWEVRTVTITSPFNTASADSVISNAIPPWLSSQASTNDDAYSTLLFPQTSNGPEPTWFATLPSILKSYYMSGMPVNSGQTGSSSQISKPLFSISISAITQAGTPTTTLISIPNSTAISNLSSNTSTASGNLAGSIVGAIGGTALVVGLGTYLLRRSRRQRQAVRNQSEPSSVEQGLTGPEKESEAEPKSGGGVELEANEPFIELATSTHVAELPTPAVINELDGRVRSISKACPESNGSEASENEVHDRFRSNDINSGEDEEHPSRCPLGTSTIPK